MKKIVLAAVAMAAMAASCSFYKPQAVDIPLINHAGDLRVDGNVSLSTLTIVPTSMGFNMTGTYGAGNWLAAQAFLTYDGERGGMAHVAVGAYYPYRKFVVEGYLGTGTGYTSPYNTNSSSSSDPVVVTENPGYQGGSSATLANIRSLGGHFDSYFLQVNAGWVDLAKGHIDLGFGIKQGWLNHDFGMEQVADGSTSVRRFQGVTSFTEPQLMFRTGGNNLKFTVKLGFLIMPAEFVYSNFTISAGLNFRL